MSPKAILTDCVFSTRVTADNTAELLKTAQHKLVQNIWHKPLPLQYRMCWMENRKLPIIQTSCYWIGSKYSLVSSPVLHQSILSHPAFIHSYAWKKLLNHQKALASTNFTSLSIMWEYKGVMTWSPCDLNTLWPESKLLYRETNTPPQLTVRKTCSPFLFKFGIHACCNFACQPISLDKQYYQQLVAPTTTNCACLMLACLPPNWISPNPLNEAQ